MIKRLQGLVNMNDKLMRRGRFLNLGFLVKVGDVPYYIIIQSGRIVSVNRHLFQMRSWRFAIRATAETWKKFWEQIPKPGYNEIFAMTKRGEARIECDLQPLLATSAI